MTQLSNEWNTVTDSSERAVLIHGSSRRVKQRRETRPQVRQTWCHARPALDSSRRSNGCYTRVQRQALADTQYTYWLETRDVVAGEKGRARRSGGLLLSTGHLTRLSWLHWLTIDRAPSETSAWHARPLSSSHDPIQQFPSCTIGANEFNRRINGPSTTCERIEKRQRRKKQLLLKVTRHSPLRTRVQ